MLILPAEADEKVVSTAIDRITKVVSADGGEVSDIDRWGRRRFAFEIDHANEGYYVVATFTAEPAAQAELDRVLNLADEVIRHKVIASAGQGAPRQAGRGPRRAAAIERDRHGSRSFPRPRVSHTRGGCDTDKVVT